MTEKTTDDEELEELEYMIVCQETTPFANERTIVTEEFTIIEDGTGAVNINGFVLYGYVDGGICTLCGGMIRIWDAMYDQYFCPSCNLWVEPFCKDPTCRYCSIERPPRPLPLFGTDDEKTYPKRSSQGWGKMKFVKIDA